MSCPTAKAANCLLLLSAVLSLRPDGGAVAPFSPPAVLTERRRSPSRRGCLRSPAFPLPSSVSSSGCDDGVSGEETAADGHATRRHISASEWARREEDRRRLQRADDVAVGRTSALPGETDYAIDASATEATYLASLPVGSVDREVSLRTDEGLDFLRLLRVEDAAASFRRVYDLKPEAYLWQDGLARYHLGDLRGAAASFAANAARWESRFGEPASEERIWRDACELRMRVQLGTRRARMKKRVRKADREEEEEEEQVDQAPPEDESISREGRKVIRIARELFASSLADDISGVALARAKLRAICGDFQSCRTPSPAGQKTDLKMWKLSSWFYLGLHYDSYGDVNDAKACMKMALRQCPDGSGNSSDVTYVLPLLHMTTRDWFDDDEFEPECEYGDGEDDGGSGDRDEREAGGASVRGLGLRSSEDHEDFDKATLVEMIEDSLKGMKIIKLRDELRKRALKLSGSKQELRDRLTDAVRRDLGV